MLLDINILKKGKDYIDVIVDNQYSQISLVGSDKDKFKDGTTRI